MDNNSLHSVQYDIDNNEKLLVKTVKSIKATVMLTPCNHYYHPSCL